MEYVSQNPKHLYAVSWGTATISVADTVEDSQWNSTCSLRASVSALLGSSLTTTAGMYSLKWEKPSCVYGYASSIPRAALSDSSHQQGRPVALPVLKRELPSLGTSLSDFICTQQGKDIILWLYRLNHIGTINTQFILCTCIILRGIEDWIHQDCTKIITVAWS